MTVMPTWVTVIATATGEPGTTVHVTPSSRLYESAYCTPLRTILSLVTRESELVARVAPCYVTR